MVLYNSQFTATSSSQLYPAVRAVTVYYPVAQTQLRQSQAERSETRAELHTPEQATVIIQVSRMEGWKGHTLHLEALSLLKDLPGWVCWQVGGAQRPSENQYLEDLKRKAAQLGIAERVRFLDQRSDVARLLAAADVFCQPNIVGEPFGIVFIEALYARLPVVTTDIGGGREIVNDSCGVLVPVGDAPALEASLRGLIQDHTLRARLGNAGPTRAHQLCDPKVRMEQFREALDSNNKL
jgi:glycosyltransferase involved in cell wall biosynthesis